MKQKTITVDQFLQDYKPLLNPFDSRNGAWNNCAFETYGEELNAIMKFYEHYPKHVWTIMDTGEVISGIHTINRLSYLITEKPFYYEETIEVLND